jgi:hypothetical protein
VLCLLVVNVKHEIVRVMRYSNLVVQSRVHEQSAMELLTPPT